MALQRRALALAYERLRELERTAVERKAVERQPLNDGKRRKVRDCVRALPRA